VLLCDVGGPCGGLSLYAGIEAPRSLAGAANSIAAGEPPQGGMFAEGGAGLRLLAGGPELDAEADREALARLLRDARQAHDLTVVDCGTLRTAAERAVLEAATHVAWIVPATLSGLRRGRRTLELFGLDRDREEVLVARHDHTGRTAPTEELAALAVTRSAPLVLMPDVPDLGEEDEKRGLEAAALTLDALWSVIRR
jgi:Flp pilus assembly CpaE family ATPase